MHNMQGYARLCASVGERLESLVARLESSPGDLEAVAALRRLRRALGAFGGSLEGHFRPGSLRPGLERILARMEPKLPVTSRVEGPLELRLDEALLEEALAEVLDNSHHAGARRITVSAQMRTVAAADVPAGLRAGSYIALEVRDDGSGIPASLRHRALWPTVSNWQREGLGLALVQGVAAAHGGWVSISNEPRGVNVRLMLPSSQAAHEAGDDHQGVTILVVDDEPLALKAIRRVLQVRGFQLLTAETGQRALELLETAPALPKVLISDINMPGMSGVELAQKLRERLPEVAVLFVCGYPPEGLELPSGSHFLAKPFSHDELLRAVSNALQSR